MYQVHLDSVEVESSTLKFVHAPALFSIENRVDSFSTFIFGCSVCKSCDGPNRKFMETFIFLREVLFQAQMHVQAVI